jgi:hypothetical protein
MCPISRPEHHPERFPCSDDLLSSAQFLEASGRFSSPSAPCKPPVQIFIEK